MAREFTSIRQALKGIDNATLLGTKRALNRSVTTTRSFISRDVRKETGLKAKDINSRLKANKTQSGLKNKYSFNASVGVAMKALFPLRMFSPKRKKVKSVRGLRLGATVKIGKRGRELVDNAFVMTLKNGREIVASRKGSARTPTMERYTRLWQETINGSVKTYRKFIRTEFDRIKKSYVSGALKQRFNPTNSEE